MLCTVKDFPAYQLYKKTGCIELDKSLIVIAEN